MAMMNTEKTEMEENLGIESGFKALSVNSQSMEQSETKGEEESVRHCAFCLNQVPCKDVIKCEKCQKRAYCSKECKSNDWTLNCGGGSQGHENWCGLECGEEDVDWQVAPVEGKGLGLIAKRLLPARFRILVDTPRELSHPKVMDLMPLNGSLDEKFELNSVGGGENGERSICLRIARANHDCDPNAAHYYDETFKVKILFAEREIAPGEEICISYTGFNDISKELSSEDSRSMLKSEWGITCPDNCFCRNQQINTLLAESRILDSQIMNTAIHGNQRAALRLVKKLLKHQATLHCSLINQQRTLYDGFQIAIMKEDTIEIGQDCIRRVHEIISSIISPKSEEVLRFLSYANDVSRHPMYRAFQLRVYHFRQERHSVKVVNSKLECSVLEEYGGHGQHV